MCIRDRHMAAEAVRQMDTAGKEAAFRMGAAVNGLRALASVDFAALTEGFCGVEAVFRTDPAGVYPKMDEASRSRYRTPVSYTHLGTGLSFSFRGSWGFTASDGIPQDFPNLRIPSIRPSAQYFCTSRSEIFHFFAASCTVMYSIRDLHAPSLGVRQKHSQFRTLPIHFLFSVRIYEHFPQ